MSDLIDLKNAAWSAMDALPKPVAKADALAAALTVLPKKEQGEFTKWFSKNGDAIVTKLNLPATQ